MKKVMIAVTILAFLLIPLKASAQTKAKIGISLPTLQRAGLYWWRASVATELQDLLASELEKTGSFSVQKLDVTPGRGDFKSDGKPTEDFMARIFVGNLPRAVIWSITSFEKTSAKGGKAKVSIGMRLGVIDAETGEIVDARTIECTATGEAVVINHEEQFDLSDIADTAVGLALKDGIGQIVSLITDRDSGRPRKKDNH